MISPRAKRSRQFLLTALGTGFLSAALFHGCSSTSSSSGPTSPGPDASPPDAQPYEASTGWDSDSWLPHQDAQPDREAYDAPPGPLPDGVPEGWERYSEWPEACQFFVPGAHGQLPAPLEWEPCPPNAGTDADCQRIKPSWTKGQGRAIGQGYPSFSIDPGTGRPLLVFSRATLNGNPDWSDRIAAELDGTIRFSFLQLTTTYYSSGCRADLYPSYEGKIAIQLYGDSPSDDHGYNSGAHEGIIAGGVDDRHPPLVINHTLTDQSPARMSVASKQWFYEYFGGKLFAHDWGFHQAIPVYEAAADPDGLPIAATWPSGKAVFLEVSEGGNSYVHAWTQQDGNRPLLHWYGDTSRGAGQFGTDGHDMVWTYGEGKPPGGSYDEYHDYWVMTAPFSTDPAQVQSQARRLRQELLGERVIGDPEQGYKVGCGYAARTTWRRNVFVIRLSDGYSWLIPYKEIDRTWGWKAVLGVTCDEVFVLAVGNGTKEVTSIARIKLSSLGEPIPPDQPGASPDAGR